MELRQVKTLNHYPVGSAMAFIDGRLCLVGDNMGYLLVLDTDFAVTDTISFADTPQNPMPKDQKPDIESTIAISRDELLLIGSGSLAPRNNAWIINIATKQKNKIDLLPFYDRLRAHGLPELNIEGAATVQDVIVLSNRGNKAHPQNHLIFTTASFWNEQATATISIRTIGKGNGSNSFSGVSGMDYSALSDRLILTVSTEDTYNSYTDGAIGKSYLWLVNDMARKKTAGALTPDRIIDLEAVDSRFKAQKIEAVCILSETASEMVLALAADNDDGNTKLFKLAIQKQN